MSICWAQQAPPVKQPLVTNIFADTDLRQALADVAVQTDTTIIADNTVQGTVTVDLKEAPLERALTIMLQAGGYAFAKVTDYYLVGMPDPTNPNYPLLTRTEVVTLKHLTPQMVMALLNGTYDRYLSTAGIPPSTLSGRSRTTTGDRFRAAPSRPGGDVSLPDQRLIITAPPALIERIRAEVLRLDVPRTQVVLEAMVVELSERKLKELGINWSSRWLSQDLSTNNGTPTLTYSEIANVEMVKLTALIENGNAMVRANPRVATLEGQTAELEVGKENYFAIVTGSLNYQYTTLEKITSGILLRITPRVVEPDEVITAVEPEVRDVTGRGKNDLPEISFRRAATTLRVKDGSRIVIGGLVNETDSKTVRKVPLLGDIPLLGHLFRRTVREKVRTEVVIVITPRIVRDGLGIETIASQAMREQVQPPPPPPATPAPK